MRKVSTALSCAVALASGIIGCSSSTNKNGSSAGSSSGSGSSSGASGGSGGTSAGQGDTATCSTGTLFAGDPQSTADSNARAANHDPIIPTSDTLAPLQWGNIIFVGTDIYTRETAGSIWRIDTTTSPMTETLVAGQVSEQDKSALEYHVNDTCANTKLTFEFGLGAGTDGSLYVSDWLGNSVLKITHPNDAGCHVDVLAGNAANGTFDGEAFNAGTILDGNGLSAEFAAPTQLVVDSSNNVYVQDGTDASGHVVRKIDASGKVTTIATLGTDPGVITKISEFAVNGTTLYAAGKDGSSGNYIVQIDTVGAGPNNKITTIVGGRGKFDPIDSSASAHFGGFAYTGSNFYVAGTGYIWKVSLSGSVTLVAGIGEVSAAGFPPSDYNAKGTNTAATLKMPYDQSSEGSGDSGAYSHLAYHNGVLYFTGKGNGVSSFVEAITCGQ